MNREAIYAALFAKLQAAAQFNVASRRLKHFNDVGQGDQPALYVVQRTEIAATVPGLNTVWNLHVDVYLYARTKDPDVAASTILNPLIDAVTNALAVEPMSNKQTLGGLVQHAWIEGQIQTDEGVLGDQGVAIIPIVMKVV